MRFKRAKLCGIDGRHTNYKDKQVRDRVSPFLQNLHLFQDPIYQGFEHQPNQSSIGGALLLHGFPGTPADMRDISAVLVNRGWAVDAPLLPGFGQQIAQLPTKQLSDWVTFVERKIIQMRNEYGRVVVVGHSIGAALALIAGARVPPDAQLLMAPSWKLGGSLRGFLWPIIRLLARRWRPLKNVNFDDVHVQQGIIRIVPDIDLSSESVRTELRQLNVPTAFLEQMAKLGRRTLWAAKRSNVPTQIIQGVRDDIVQPRDTDRLASAIKFLSDSTLVNGSHRLTDPADGAWGKIELAIERLVQSPGNGVTNP